MKTCYTCKSLKPLSDFGKFAQKPDGLSIHCLECSRARNRKAVRKINEWFNDYKSKLSCETCGQNHPATLDFHHKDPSEKDGTVARMVQNRCTIEVIQAEIDKCSVLCANCHRILHYEERLNNV